MEVQNTTPGKQDAPAPLTMEERHPDTPFVNAWLHSHNPEYNFAAYARKEKEPTPHELAMIRAALPHLQAAREAEREGRRDDARPHLMAFVDTILDFKAQEKEDAQDGEGKP